jgi:hypothetical protein
MDKSIWALNFCRPLTGGIKSPTFRSFFSNKKKYSDLCYMVESSMKIDGRSSEAIRYWMPLAAIAAGIVFVIAFVLRLPPDRTIVASALAAIMVFSGFFFRSFGRDRDKYKEKTDSI